MLERLNYILHYGPKLCSHLAPHESEFRALNLAMVCGIEPDGGRAWQLFVDTGLVHILVVSGAHLIFVERWLARVLPNLRARLAVLTAYVWLTGFGAPALRALMRRILTHLMEPWGWTALQVEAAATALLVLGYPPSLLSRSFLMSWLCALALQLPPHPRGWRALTVSVKCWLFLLPFCPNSPLVIAWNGLLGPLVGRVLFPLITLSFLVPYMWMVSDEAWRALLWILSEGPKVTPSAISLQPAWLWWLPLALHTLMLVGETQWRRAFAFGS